MRLLIIGASDSGVTTLGYALAQELTIPYFDADLYYCEETGPDLASPKVLFLLPTSYRLRSPKPWRR